MERFDDRPAGGSGGGGRDGRSGRDRSPVASRDPRELARLHEQLPPHAPEAEMSLLGSMLVDPKVTGDVLLILKSGEDFFRPAHGTIFDAMVELYDQHNALDIVQLHRVLEDRKVLESVGGVGYLVDLAAAVPSAANAERYARIVRDKANLRRLIEAAGAVLWDAHHSAETAADVLEAAEQRIYQIRTQAEQTKAESMQDLVMEVMRMVEANEGKLITGVPTGYHDLDEMTHGLQPGEMIILAARPSMGKTAFALNVAEQVAMQGYPVGVFSLEMSKSALVQRLLSARSGVDSQRIRRGMLGREEWDALERACGELYDAPLLIDDTPGITLLQMRAKARRMASSHGVRMLVIDYLQLMSSGRRAESRQVEISEISRGIKAMARELEVPVICLSQLNRAAEQREGHRPRMSDLRESGSIEQDADVVAMLHREEYYHVGDEDWFLHNEDKVGLAELILAKQRNGPTGTVKLTWSRSTTRFLNHSAARPPEGWNDDPAPASAIEAKGGADAGDGAPRSRSAFSAKAASGPVSGFRDGGGPDDADLGDLPV